MGKFQVERKHSNIGLFIVIAIAYIALLLLFGWQTWEFVNVLFPDDQLLMKLLTVFSFDVMALIFGAAHLFYRFAHPHAKTAVGWGWAITNLLSLVATIIYMVIQSMFRFRVAVSTDVVNFGYGVTIAALVFDLSMIAIFLYSEISTRFPNEDEFELIEPQKHRTPVQPPAQHSLPQQSSHVMSSEEDRYEWLARQMLITERQQQEHQARLEAARVRILAEQQHQTMQPQQSPFQQPPLDTTASQPGTNGNTNGHQKSQA